MLYHTTRPKNCLFPRAVRLLNSASAVNNCFDHSEYGGICALKRVYQKSQTLEKCMQPVNKLPGLLYTCDVTNMQSPPSAIPPTWLWLQKQQQTWCRNTMTLPVQSWETWPIRVCWAFCEGGGLKRQAQDQSDRGSIEVLQQWTVLEK